MAFDIDTGNDGIVNIKVVGIGGCGCNVVNRMITSGMRGVEFIAINTDKQVLMSCAATQKLQIGEKLTQGRGAGSNPDVGRKSAEESRGSIAKSLEGTNMVFLTAGMGGGTGTGAAPIIAEIAREMGILTVGVVSRPFKFEGKRRMDHANTGIEELRTRVDSLVVIPNERLQSVTEKEITFLNAFAIADDVLRQAVQSISDLIKESGLINLDFADVTAVMKDAGFAHMGVGRAGGKNKAEEAAKIAIESPLLETSINGAHGVIVNITGSTSLRMEDVNTAVGMVEAAVSEEANIIFGASFDDELDDEMRIIVIATDFGGPDAKPTFKGDVVSDGTDSDEPSVHSMDAPVDDFEVLFKMFEKRDNR